MAMCVIELFGASMDHRTAVQQAAFKKQGGFHPYKSERDYREKYEHALFERFELPVEVRGNYLLTGAGHDLPGLRTTGEGANRRAAVT